MTVSPESSDIDMNSPSPICVPDTLPAFEKCVQNVIKKVLFVCTGNTCRSPMAAAWLNHYGREVGLCASSAGLFPIVGQPISKNAADALRNSGIEPSPDNRYDLHEAVRITPEMIENCDTVVGISRSHTMKLICEFPKYASKIICMPSDIPDPYGGDLDDYKKCLCEMADGIKSLFKLDV